MENVPFFQKLGKSKVPIASICLWVYALLSIIYSMAYGYGIAANVLIGLSLIAIGVFSMIRLNQVLLYCTAGLSLLELIFFFVSPGYGALSVISNILSVLAVLGLVFILGTQFFKPIASLKGIGKKLFFIPAAVECLALLLRFIANLTWWVPFGYIFFWVLVLGLHLVAGYFFLTLKSIFAEEAPAAPAPQYQRPVAPQPQYQQPYQQPAAPQPQYQQPYQQPVAPQPQYQQPYQQPAAPQPQYQQPVVPQPQYQQPVAPQPQYQQPAAPQPQYQQPVVPQPQYQQPAAPQPQYQQPAAPQPQYQQPGAPQ